MSPLLWDFLIFALGCIAGGGLTFSVCAYLNFDPMAGAGE